MTQLILPISIGQTCQTRFQLARWYYVRRFPHATLNDFRSDLFGRVQEAKLIQSQIFDWQITPHSALCEWLERDFTGIFEHADLEIIADGTDVRNRRFGTLHPHSFHSPTTQEIIDKDYSEVRSRYEALAERFRNLSDEGSPLAFILYSPDQQIPVDRIKEALRPYCRGEVQLWIAPTEVAQSKPEESRWEGDDDVWDRFLSDRLLST